MPRVVGCSEGAVEEGMLGVLEEEAVEGGGREVECDQVVGGADILTDVSSSVELPGLIPMRSLYQVLSRVAAAAQSVNGRVGDAEGVARRQERSIRGRWSCFVRAPEGSKCVFPLVTSIASWTLKAFFCCSPHSTSFTPRHLSLTEHLHVSTNLTTHTMVYEPMQ